MKIKLTPLQIDMLKHRLEVPDALADVFEEDYHEDDVYLVCQMLIDSFGILSPSDRGLDLAPALAYSEELTHDIIKDCIEGSTWFGGMDDESHQKQRAHRDAFMLMLPKLEVACDFHCITLPPEL